MFYTNDMYVTTFINKIMTLIIACHFLYKMQFIATMYIFCISKDLNMFKFKYYKLNISLPIVDTLVITEICPLFTILFTDVIMRNSCKYTPS